jgi:hypothetical protein
VSKAYVEYTSRVIDTGASDEAVGVHMTDMDKKGWNIHSITPLGNSCRFLVVHWKNMGGSPK